MSKISDDLVKRLDRILELLERQTALMISNQLLTECVGLDGNPRSAEECADIVTESYSAALCLHKDLENRNKQFDYQCAEFFVDEDEDSEDDDDDDDYSNTAHLNRID